MELILIKSWNYCSSHSIHQHEEQAVRTVSLPFTMNGCTLNEKKRKKENCIYSTQRQQNRNVSVFSTCSPVFCILHGVEHMAVKVKTGAWGPHDWQPRLRGFLLHKRSAAVLTLCPPPMVDMTTCLFSHGVLSLRLRASLTLDGDVPPDCGVIP